jgi:hypothetical protein
LFAQCVMAHTAQTTHNTVIAKLMMPFFLQPQTPNTSGLFKYSKYSNY